MPLSRVFEPIKIGPVTVKNRIVRTAHGTHLCTPDGNCDDLAAYHGAPARGGVGLTIVEVMGVHPSCSARLNYWNDNLEQEYEKILKACEPHGMTIFQQLWHGGHNHLASAVDGNPLKMEPPWSSSEIPSVWYNITPFAMTTSMIDEIVDGYVRAAEKCLAIGLKGIEIHAGHGYLMHQFLSPILNQREDDYGGSFENRLRFPLAVLRGVRNALSSRAALGVRLSPDLQRDGLDVALNKQILATFEEEKLIDYVNLSHGSYHRVQPIIGGMHKAAGYQLETSNPIAEESALVRIATGRYRTLDEAEQTLKDSPIDMISMVRATIADPDLVKKTQEGRPEDVRSCIGCNQGCVMGFGFEGRIGCTVNPAAGMEKSLDQSNISTAKHRKKVVVVGGGPSGMEASRIAAIRGHEVVLFEASPHLGGAVNTAGRCPGRYGIKDITVWLEEQVFKLGVDIRLNHYVDANDVISEKPDAVIVATGSYTKHDGVSTWRPAEPISGFTNFGVMTSEELIWGDQSFENQQVLVYDDLGHFEALSCAELLVEKGANVIFVTRHRMIAHLAVGSLNVTPALERLSDSGKFSFRTYTRILELSSGQAILQPVFGGPEEIIACDGAVFVPVNASYREVWSELQGKVEQLHITGDAKAQRFLQTAIKEGHLAARAL